SLLCPAGSLSQPTGGPSVPLLRGYPLAWGSHIPPRECSGGEEGEAGGEAVQEVPLPHRAQFPGAEAPRQGERAEERLHHRGVVVGLAEEALPPPVAGEEQGGVGLGRGEQIAQV